MEYNYFGGIFKLDHDYLMTAGGISTLLFHRSQGTWTQIDDLNGVLAWNSAGQTIDPPWAFIVGDVYRFGPHGQFEKTQTLADNLPPSQTSFGGTDAAEGDTLAIADTSYNNIQGIVYAYTLRQGQWVEKQQLISSDGTPEDSFGIGISISGDLMAIEASGKNLRYENPACPGTYYTGGAVYIFKRIRGQWTQQQEIDADCMFFGQLSVNQEWLAINGGSNNVVYHRSHEQGLEMFAPFAQSGPDIFGYSMSLFGSILLVGTGASEEFPPGQVYVYNLRDKAR